MTETLITPTRPKLSIEHLSPELRRAAKEARYANDFPLFWYEQGVVQIRGVGLVPVKESVWDFQMPLAELLVTEPRLVILKARQLGVSTELMHLGYHTIRFGKPNSQHVLVLSKSKSDASYLLDKVPQINDNIDRDLRMEVTTNQTFEFGLVNGNTIECVASTESGGRSRAATVVIMDEHAFHNFAQKNWAAVSPTLDGGGHFYVISTANGMGNMFHGLYEKAKKQQQIEGSEKSHTFKAVFIPYDAPQHRDEAWRESQRANHVGDEQLFNQEYPRTDVEAFAKTGTCPFDAQYIAECITEGDSNPPIETRDDGRTRIWVKPEAGMLYSAGLDCMQGVSENKNVDFHSLKIVDQFGRHVASYESQDEVGAAAREMFALLLSYNRPLLVVERNSSGVGFISSLQALGYKHFYQYDRKHFEPDAPEPKNPKPKINGIQQTQTTKRLLVQNLVGKVNSRSLRSRDSSFLRECLGFSQLGPNKWGAEHGHDDQVIGMALAAWGLPHLRHPKPKRKKQYRWR